MSIDPKIIIRPALNFLCGSVSKRKLQILIYHRVLAEKDVLQPSEPTVAEFRWQMEIVAKHFYVLPLSVAVDLLYQGALPERSICITFDDGYADNLTLALPELERLNLPATVFVASGYLNGGIMFNDVVLECIRQFDGKALDLAIVGLSTKYPCQTVEEKRHSYQNIINNLKYLPADIRDEKVNEIAEKTATKLPTNLMLTNEQLMALSETIVDIGAHTVNHPILKELDDVAALREIEEGRDFLLKLLRKPVSFFAYPNGLPGRDYAAHHPRLLEELGFSGAVSTASGYSTRRSDRYQLCRFTPWDKTPGRFLIRLLRNYVGDQQL